MTSEHFDINNLRFGEYADGGNRLPAGPTLPFRGASVHRNRRKSTLEKHPHVRDFDYDDTA